MISKEHMIDLSDGRFDRTTPEDLSKMFQTISQVPTGNNLVVHFHGGLVSRKSALETADRYLLKTYQSGNGYPVFFIWNSDILTTLTHNLDEISKEKIFRRLVRRIAQFALGKLGEKADVVSKGGKIQEWSLKKVPEDLTDLQTLLDEEERTTGKFHDPVLHQKQEQQFENTLKNDRVLKEESMSIAASLLSDEELKQLQEQHAKSRGAIPLKGSANTLLSQKILDEIKKEAPEPGQKGIGTFLTIIKYGVKIFAAVLKRYRNGRDHGLYTTIVEEILRELYIDNIGALGWKMMKNDACDAFGDNPEIHGGTAFLRKLKDQWHPGQRLTLVGHSTGAIYIGCFLEHAANLLPDDAHIDVIFLAPACTFDFIHERLDLFKNRVNNFRLFGLNDEIEKGYWEVPLVYRGSLLYMVSGLFENDEIDKPLIGMERYYTRSDIYNSTAVQNVKEYIIGRQFWSPCDAGPGKRNTAEKHGQLDDNEKVRDSLEYILKNGF